MSVPFGLSPTENNVKITDLGEKKLHWHQVTVFVESKMHINCIVSPHAFEFREIKIKQACRNPLRY